MIVKVFSNCKYRPFNTWRRYRIRESRLCCKSDSDGNEENNITGKCGPFPKKPKTIRWGIAPVSTIADDFVTALRVLPAYHHKVVACSACYRSVAKAFAQKHDIRKYYSNFRSLAKNRNIDVVYISSLNPWHLELSRLMLNHGKHVLCEKPLCMNEDQAIQLIGHSHTVNRFLLEGMWSRFTPAYRFIRQQIETDAMGCVLSVQCSYGVPMLDVERVAKSAFGGGVTMELGVYGIQLAQWAFRRFPLKITATGKLNEDCVDICADIEINYGCGRCAKIKLSAMEYLENAARIKGTKGTMTIPEYWCPKKIQAGDQEQCFELPKADAVKTLVPNHIALSYEAEEVRNCLLQQQNQSASYSHNEILTVARVVDEVRRQLGVVYKEDRQ